MGFRILPLGVWRAHTAQLIVYAVSGQLVSWDLEFCLWVPGDQTLLGIELHMQLLGQFITGIG